MADPILVPCEGGGCPPIRMTIDPATFSTNAGIIVGLCSMCGTWHPIGDGNVIDEHQRDDVLARIHRGDFGGTTPDFDDQEARP